MSPFGGITAAISLKSVLQHPALLGEPVSLMVNHAGALAAGAFQVSAQPVRTHRSGSVMPCQTDADGQTQVTTPPPW